MGERSYSAYGAQTLVPMGQGVTLGGTAAAITGIAGCIFKVPSTWNGQLKSVSAYIVTGGTVGSAGVKGLIQRSLAGTGAYVTIGSLAFLGTYADATVLAGGVDSTVTVLGGDILRLAVAAGTVAQTLVVTVACSFQEAFVSE